MENSFFKVQDLKCGYGNGFHIKGVSLEISKGELVGIIGPNGSGKTTLFKGISGDLKAKQGEILLDGEILHKLNLKQRAKKVAVVSQFQEVAAITVEDFVMMGRLPYRQRFQFFESSKDSDLVKKYMKQTGVYKHRKKLMSQLSGGEQQLAAIAQALCQEPQLLLMDEPTSHLDITHQVKVLNLIQKLNSEMGLTVLLIIHDLNLAAEYCHKLIAMKKGKVHSFGNTEEVLTYSMIEDVYKTVVVTETNPLSGKPAIFLVSDNVLEQERKKYGEIRR